jgi:hypothetical protein
MQSIILRCSLRHLKILVQKFAFLVPKKDSGDPQFEDFLKKYIFLQNVIIHVGTLEIEEKKYIDMFLLTCTL